MEVKLDKVKLRHFRDCTKSKVVKQYRRWICKIQAFLFDRLMVTTYYIVFDENQTFIHFRMRRIGMCWRQLYIPMYITDNNIMSIGKSAITEEFAHI